MSRPRWQPRSRQLSPNLRDMDYNHTQQVSGVWLTSLLVVSSGPGVAVPIALGSPAAAVIPWAILAFLLAFVILRPFSALTVTITSGCLEAAFRWGWPRKQIARSDIASIQVVRHSAWQGWGIRWVPGGWLWRIWGRSGVQVTMVEGAGKHYTFGTDDPEGLSQALDG